MVKPLTLYLYCLLLIGPVAAQSTVDPSDSYDQGVKFKSAQKYPQALTAFKDAVEKAPANTEALYEVGWVSNELKQFDDAVTYLQKAQAIKPTASVYFELAYAYENSGRKDEAKEYYRKVLELVPKYYDADKHLGDIFFREENYTSALNHYKRYFDETKTPEAYTYFNAGRCSNELKDYVDAQLYFEKYKPVTALEFARKYSEIGYAYLMTGYNDDAVSAYQKALDVIPDYGVALRGMADVYYNNLENYPKALGYFNLALQKDEANSKECYYKAGWIYVNQQKYPEAVTALQKAADYDPKDAACREQLAYAYFMQNKYDSAITAFNAAIDLDPQSKVSYYYKGLSYASMGEKENAMEAYAQLKPLDRDAAEKLLKEVKQKEKMLKSLTSSRGSKNSDPNKTF